MEKNKEKRYKVFVIMPFGDDFFEMFEMLKREFAQNYEFSNAAEEGNIANILQDIIEPIYKADIIIADLTGLNPNVMYELGIAHSFGKKTIIITKDNLSELPFDLKQYRAKDYSTHFIKFAELIAFLRINMEGAVDGKVDYSNPVKDFLRLSGINDIKPYDEQQSILEDIDENGFLDFLAEIENNGNVLTNEIEKMTSEMKEMSDGVSNCTKEIERVKKTGGNTTAVFIKKQVKKAAKYIDSFSQSLRSHNVSLETGWDKVESNTLALLENEIAQSEQNRESLMNYMVSLKEMKKAISNSNTSIESFRTSMGKVMGLERTLNQAVKFADADLKSYLAVTERMSGSIDRILAKSKFVIGNID